MKQELTPWYPADVKPVRVGWYICQQCNVKHWWDGEDWVEHPQSMLAYASNVIWRGLARKP